MKKIIAIMAVWDEQNMIALSIESTKDIVYEYVVIIKKGIDETQKVVEYCRDLWNLKVTIVHSELKLREARRLAITMTESYADYYLIQDGDEIYFTTEELKKMGRITIPDLIEQDYDFCLTSMIYLRGDLCHSMTSLTWLIEHPFLLKNQPGIFFHNHGDLPYIHYDWSKKKYKQFGTRNQTTPFKFDCNVKNFRRFFLRDLFTPWHDGNNDCTIEEYNLIHNPRCIEYRKNVRETNDINEIINHYKTFQSMLVHCKPYKEEEFYVYPEVIKKYINLGLNRGIESISDLKTVYNKDI